MTGVPIEELHPLVPGEKLRCVAMKPDYGPHPDYYAGVVFVATSRHTIAGDNGNPNWSGKWALWERVTDKVTCGDIEKRLLAGEGTVVGTIPTEPVDEGWSEWHASDSPVDSSTHDFQFECIDGIHRRRTRPRTRRISGTIQIDANGNPIDGTFVKEGE